jgi:hypothetical protein
MLNLETPTVELRSLQPTIDPSDRNCLMNSRPQQLLPLEDDLIKDSKVQGDCFGGAALKGDFRRTQEDRVSDRF